MPSQVKCPSCSQVLRVQESMAGQVIACPKCKGQMRLPASVGQAAAAPAPPPTPTPRTGGGGGSFVLVGIAAVVIGVVVVAALYFGGVFGGGGGGSAEYKSFVPAGAQFMVGIDMEAVRGSEIWKMIESGSGSQFTKARQAFRQATGADLDDTSHLYLSGSLQQKQPVTVVRFKKAASVKDADETDMEGLYRTKSGIGAGPGPSEFGLYVAGPRTLVVGPFDDVRAGAKRHKARKVSAAYKELKALLRNVGTDDVWVAVKIDTSQMAAPGMQMMPFGNMFQGLKGFAASVSVNGGIDVEAAVQTQSAESAESLLKMVNGALEMFKGGAAMGGAGGMPDAAKRVLESLSLSRKGAVMYASLSISNEDLKSLAKGRPMSPFGAPGGVPAMPPGFGAPGGRKQPPFPTRPPRVPGGR